MKCLSCLHLIDQNSEVTEAVLFEVFNAIGPVASIRVCRDAITRRSLGYAYVNFHTVGDGKNIISQNIDNMKPSGPSNNSTTLKLEANHAELCGLKETQA